MDTKKQIEQALTEIGKDRKWLATASGYSYYSVRDCLAPVGKKLSPRMHAAFLDVINRNKAPAPPPPPPPEQRIPDQITVYCEPAQRDAYELAAEKADLRLSRWIIAELDKAAARWTATQLRSVKDPKKA